MSWEPNLDPLERQQVLFIVIAQCPVLCFAPESLLGTCGLLLGLGWQTLHAGVSSAKAFSHYKITYGLRGRNVEASFFESENCHRFHEVSQALLKHTQQQYKQETQASARRKARTSSHNVSSNLHTET